MKTKQISLQQYIKKIDRNYFRYNKKNPDAEISQQAIKYRIKNNMPLPEVLKYKQIGRIHILTVAETF